MLEFFFRPFIHGIDEFSRIFVSHQNREPNTERTEKNKNLKF